MDKKITNFALDFDDATKKQFDSCCSQDYVISASLMPDAHSGYVAPIGSVLVTKEKIVPAWVGYDIGCGMIACKFRGVGFLDLLENHKEVIFSKVNESIPMGKGAIGVHGDVSEKISLEFRELVSKFKKNSYNKVLFNFINTQAQAHLGSLGSGNHFIEIGSSDFSNRDEFWLVVHSGSRGVGHKVATEYMKKAAGDDEENFEGNFAIDVNSAEGQEYLNIVDFGQDFALLNRLEMATRVANVISGVFGVNGIEFGLFCNKNHNFIEVIKDNDQFSYIHRKGATPAKIDELGVIPANMRDGCFLVKGLGNKEFLESSSHGAGRKLSRGDAKKTVKLEDFKKSMEGIVGNVTENTLDESPFAYKNVFDVMAKQTQSVEILEHIRPIINWKG
jgi:tRNA-splicing ligase RtcB